MFKSQRRFDEVAAARGRTRRAALAALTSLAWGACAEAAEESADPGASREPAGTSAPARARDASNANDANGANGARIGGVRGPSCAELLAWDAGGHIVRVSASSGATRARALVHPGAAGVDVDVGVGVGVGVDAAVGNGAVDVGLDLGDGASGAPAAAALAAGAPTPESIATILARPDPAEEGVELFRVRFQADATRPLGEPRVASPADVIPASSIDGEASLLSTPAGAVLFERSYGERWRVAPDPAAPQSPGPSVGLRTPIAAWLADRDGASGRFEAVVAAPGSCAELVRATVSRRPFGGSALLVDARHPLCELSVDGAQSTPAADTHPEADVRAWAFARLARGRRVAVRAVAAASQGPTVSAPPAALEVFDVRDAPRERSRGGGPEVRALGVARLGAIAAPVILVGAASLGADLVVVALRSTGSASLDSPPFEAGTRAVVVRLPRAHLALAAAELALPAPLPAMIRDGAWLGRGALALGPDAAALAGRDGVVALRLEPGGARAGDPPKAAVVAWRRADLRGPIACASAY